MAVAPNKLEPDNDPAPVAYDWRNDDIMAGDMDVVEIYGEYVFLEDAVDWLFENSHPVDTENL